MKITLSAPIARLIAAGLIALAAQPAAAASVTISSTPLATAGGSSVLPNLLFILDASGSMDWDYLGDYVNDSGKCMTRSGPSTTCTYGDAPMAAGGANGFNGVGYDPMVNYKPGLTSTGATVQPATLTVTAVPNDAYQAQDTNNTNITTGIQDLRYCNGNNLCKRNGALNDGSALVAAGTDHLGRTMAAGRFPYRSHDSNSSTQVFGLPEMMALGTFARAGGTVTATTIHPHGLVNNDWIHVTGTGTAIDLNAVQVTVTDANTFTYTSGTGTTSARQASYRKHSAGTFVRAGSTVTVTTATPHGMVTNDIVLVNVASNTAFNTTGADITVSDANTFTYASGASGAIAATTGTWVRNGLYNARGTVNGPALSHHITPVEYCSDANLTNCVEVIPPAAPPAGFTFPAYVRFCRTQEQAVTPGLVSDTSGTPRCRSKQVSSGSTTWTWPRFGWFNRTIITSALGPFTRSAARTDCAAAPTCTYTEEIQNYARWWTYYRTRMQMMKTAAGRAFLPFISNPSATPAVPDKLRVGFITINPNYPNTAGSSIQSTVQASRYLKIANFNTTQASSWYTKFYQQIPEHGTPLREALSRAGWLYAGKLNTGLTDGIPTTDDPVLQSCQRHFTILTSDGYWNGNGGQDLTGAAIGNLDNGNPLIDAPYSQPSVDRTTTGTFDGGKGTVIATSTPTTTLEQVVCLANATTGFSGGLVAQTTCGCTSGQHRIKQRSTINTNTITTTDGVETGNSNSQTYTYQDITACTPAYVVTDTTPAQRLQHQLCTGATTVNFGQGATVACGCAANLKRVWQQTGDRNHIVVTTDGAVTSDTYSAYTYSTQIMTGCDATVETTAQPKREEEEVICQANATTTFSAGVLGGAGAAQQACGCAGVGSGDKRLLRRTLTYTNTITKHDTVQTSNVNTAYALGGIAQTQGCTPTVATTTNTGATITEDKFCTGTSSVTLTDGTVVACACTAGRSFRVRELRSNTQVTTVLTNGLQTSRTYLGGTTSLSYCSGSCNSASNFSGTKPAGNSCGTGGSVTTNVAQSISGGASNTVTTGITAVVLTPNPNTTNNGAAVVNSSGTTITLASVAGGALTPNPKITDPNGATASSPAGTQLAIALTPNPSLPTVGAASTKTTLGGYPDTLADVAMYYFRSDLRGGSDPRGNSTGPANNNGGSGATDVSTNNVTPKAGSKDFTTHQHMITFTVGLVDGLMRYQADYEAAATGDFANIKNATNNGCFWVSGTCNWPQPLQDDASALDDLWHAAVNGRGQYYLANNADALSTGIQTALTAVNAQVAAAAASATSSPNVTQTDNQIFSTTYETNTWSGKVFAQTIDPETGNVNAAVQWHADGQLLAKVAAASDTRVLWTYDGSAGTKLKAFDWASLSAAEKLFFTNKCTPTSTMTQCTGLTTAQLVTANDGSSLVGYLRGQLGNEITIFRDRTYIDLENNSSVVQTVLGDTISAKPAYLRRPQFNYADAVTPAYSTFLSANQTRSPRVYVAANDGYLHAFHGDTGEEMWAYLPRFLMPGLYQLADTGYASLHRYYADGSPETGEVFDSVAGAWKSILIAGVAGGGRGFYALDITDPSNPKGLWEFCSDATLCALWDADLGLSYGNPIIGKRALDGKWIVMLTSGLNNTGPGTGVGYFYILDAITGALLHKVPTTAGSLTTPSGLMKAAAFYDGSAFTDATFRYAYAGDQLGNVWRIDTRTDPPTVLHMATLTDGSTPPRGQPITTKMPLTTISGKRVLYVGTGRYLGSPDLSDPTAASGISWQQTLWAFKDKDADYGNIRAGNTLVQQTLSQLSPTTRGISTNPVDWNTKDGWYVDFNPSFAGVPASPGEGVNLVDPRLVQGTVHVVTNIPASGGTSCSTGGSSEEYQFDFKSGAAIGTSAGGVVGRSLGGTITVGVAIVQLPSGAIKSISTGADTSKTTSSVNTSAVGAAVRRFSYRVR